MMFGRGHGWRQAFFTPVSGPLTRRQFVLYHLSLMKIQHALLSILLIQTAPAVVPWTAAQIEQPASLAARMKEKPGEPVIVQVGFETLYRSNHISKSEYAGPASTPQGLETLRKKLSAIPRDADLVLYCGCCPFDKCP